jgi:hypothetical protein
MDSPEVGRAGVLERRNRPVTVVLPSGDNRRVRLCRRVRSGLSGTMGHSRHPVEWTWARLRRLPSLAARKWDGLCCFHRLSRPWLCVSALDDSWGAAGVRSILYVTLQEYVRQDRRTPVRGNLHHGNRDRLGHPRSPNPPEPLVGEGGMAAQCTVEPTQATRDSAPCHRRRRRLASIAAACQRDRAPRDFRVEGPH